MIPSQWCDSPHCSDDTMYDLLGAEPERCSLCDVPMTTDAPDALEADPGLSGGDWRGEPWPAGSPTSLARAEGRTP